MSDLLEKLIRENKVKFESEAPEGHFERFEEKLNHEFGKKKNPKFQYLWQIAAAIVFVLLVGNQVRMYMQTETEEAQPVSLGSVSPEYAEVEFYYTSAIEQGMKTWNQLVKNGNISPENQRLMSEEIEEFEETYASLQKELQANPDDERVINAMLEVYRSKLSIINLIIEKLEYINLQNQIKNETES